MAKYLYCGLTLLSPIAFPELAQTNSNETGLFLDLKAARPQSAQYLWIHHWLSPDGEILISYRKQDACHWLRFPGLADFRLSQDTVEISCTPVPGVPIETIRHLLLDQVLPRCLAHQGRILLHASAVRLEQGVLIFIGDSGAGKSTLAGDFHQAGSPVLSDDCVWIRTDREQITAVPSYGGLRLWEDSIEALFSMEQNAQPMAHYSTKKRIPVHEGEQPGSGLPILAVIVLTPTSERLTPEITLDRLSFREAFIAVMKQTFQLDLGDLERMSGHMQAVGRIIPGLPAYRLAMPRDYSLLPVARQKILEAVL